MWQAIAYIFVEREEKIFMEVMNTRNISLKDFITLGHTSMRGNFPLLSLEDSQFCHWKIAE